MKKSPLSTPSAPNRRKHTPYNWSPHEGANRRGGYQPVKNGSYQCFPANDGQQTSGGDDFIPLNMSTPVAQYKKHSGNWYSPGGGRNNINAGRGSNYRNNYYATPNRSICNNSFSPYKNSGRQFHGQRKGDKGAHRRVNISQYVDMSSFLEDPWENLLKKLNDSKGTSEMPNIESRSNPTELADSDSTKKFESKLPRDANLDDSACSRESKTESSVDVSFGAENVENISNTSKADSSIDLGISGICFSQSSLSDTCSISNSVSGATEKKDNTHSDELATDTTEENV